MRPDEHGQMGLTDLYPWAKEKASPSPVQVYYELNTMRKQGPNKNRAQVLGDSGRGALK